MGNRTKRPPYLLGLALIGLLSLGAAPMQPAEMPREAAARWHFFPNLGQSIARRECMRKPAATPAWPWFTAMIVLTLGVVVSYFRIFVFWRKAYMAVPAPDRNT